MQEDKKTVTVKEVLAKIVTILNAVSKEKYTINCFNYNNLYEYIGTHHDYPLGGELRREKFIAITTVGYDVENMFCGFLNYPEEYSEFYETGNFILFYSRISDFNEILEATIDIDDLADFLEERYGLPQEIKDEVLKTYNGTKNLRKRRF